MPGCLSIGRQQSEERLIADATFNVPNAVNLLSQSPFRLALFSQSAMTVRDISN